MAVYTVTSPLIAAQSRAEDTENIETNAKKKCLEQGFAEHDLCPFVSKTNKKTNVLLANPAFFFKLVKIVTFLQKLQWSFGINPEAPVMNLTTKNRALLAYACSHAVMIYDYSSRKMLPLLGHVGICLS